MAAERPPVYRATFGGWKMSGGLSVKPVAGPFAVEVRSAKLPRSETLRWHAYLLNGQKFSNDPYKTAEDAKKFAQSQFVEQVCGWEEVR